MLGVINMIGFCGRPASRFLERCSALWGSQNLRCLSSGTALASAPPATIRPHLLLSEEEEYFQSLAEDFARNELLPYAAQWDKSKFFPVETLRKAAQVGFGGVYCSSDYGGSDLQRADAATIFESLAYGCVSTTAYLTIHNMCAHIVDSYGSTAMKEKYLASIISMDLLMSYCLTEAGSGSDAASLQTTAKKDGDYYVLNGSKAFISGGGSSDLYLIMARTGDAGPRGISCFLVESNFAGISFGKQEEKLGWNSQPTSSVILEDCIVPAENLVGEEGIGFKIAMKALDGGRINIGACSIGGAQFALDSTMDYVSNRKQFGSNLSEFQNTQFRLADVATVIHASRLMVHSAARALDAGVSTATLDAAMAKRFATDSCYNAVNDCLQLHGGYGYLKDYPIERCLRDLRVHTILEGTNEVMRLIINRKMRDY